MQFTCRFASLFKKKTRKAFDGTGPFVALTLYGELPAAVVAET